MRRVLSVFIAFILLTGIVEPVHAMEKSQLEAVISDTAKQVYKLSKQPQLGSVGGEWAVLGLARSGYGISRLYYDNYYQTVVNYLKKHKGVLDERKYTEYSRVILALTAAGFDPREVGGYDLTLALGDFERTAWQGINGSVFALIALDSAGYEIPQNRKAATQATRELYLAEILSRQLPDGGFALSKSGISADADITGMALQALAKYQTEAKVKVAIDQALTCLSNLKEQGFVSWGEASSESLVQIIVALCELGIEVDDRRFVINGASLLDQLMEYYIAGQGFERTVGGGADQMATEQALYALTAVYRQENDLTSLYNMRDTGINPQPGS